MERENEYAFDSKIRYSEVDETSRLTLPGIINYFQDCSIFQSEALGIGVDFLAEIGHVWLLSYWQVMVDRYPQMNEKIRIHTWATKFAGFFGYRNFSMEGEDGEEVACANSLWTYMDLNKRRPAKPSQRELDLYGAGEPLPMEPVSRKIPLPDQMETMQPFSVRRDQIDTNEHVNNCQYVQMALEALDAEAAEKGSSLRTPPVRELKVEYKKAAVYGDQVTPKIGREDGRIVVALNDEADEPYAIVELTKFLEEET